MSASRLPCLLLTPGEPAGIGPELAVRLAQQAIPAVVVAVADATLLRATAATLRLPLHVHEVRRLGDLAPLPVGAMYCWHLPLRSAVVAGQLNRANAAYVLESLDIAVDQCLAGAADAMVTGPVHKGVIADTGIAFTGHTEYLAARCKAPEPVMMLTTGSLRVALATTHLALAAVPKAITQDGLRHSLSVLHRELQTRFGIAKPRVLVAGLNPHAGEGGHLGREELDTITPVLDALRAQGMDLRGPLPADTLFTPRWLAQADAVLAMYHDQGLPVLKALGFGEAINVTLGLPIIRTSVDHGVALDLVGTGQAELGSLLAAVSLAAELASRSKAQSQCQ